MPAMVPVVVPVVVPAAAPAALPAVVPPVMAPAVPARRDPWTHDGTAEGCVNKLVNVGEGDSARTYRNQMTLVVVV